MTDVVLVPFGDRILGLTHSEFQTALERGSVLSGNTTPHSGADGDAPKRLLTAEEMEGLTGVPGTWFLGQVRRGDKTTGETVDVRTRAFMEGRPHLNYREAMTEVLRADPALKVAYAGVQ